MSGEAKKSAEAAGLSAGERISGFFAGVKAEYSKIIFPNQEDLKKETIVAIAASVFVGLLIFILDTVLKTLLGLIL